MILACSNLFIDDPPLPRNEIQIALHGTQGQPLKICLWILLFPHASAGLDQISCTCLDRVVLHLHASIWVVLFVCKPCFNCQALQPPGLSSRVTNISCEALPKPTLPYFYMTLIPSVFLSYSPYSTVAQLFMSSLFYCFMSSSTMLFYIHSFLQSTQDIAWHIGSDQ